MSFKDKVDSCIEYQPLNFGSMAIISNVLRIISGSDELAHQLSGEGRGPGC